uniref:RNA helicase n=2 Tax=Chrysotila carterae TaxID=13221 RepID=A0A7S4ERZ3_CHRCT
MTAQDTIQEESQWGAVDEWLKAKRADREVTNKHPTNAGLRDSSDTRSWMHIREIVTGGPQRSFHARQSYEQLGATKKLAASLAIQGYKQPSKPAAVAFAPIMKGESVVLACASGAGKTIAWLAPLLQRLASIEEDTDEKAAQGSVRAIVLVPNNDVGLQILDAARDLARGKIRASIATGEHKWASQKQRMGNGLELLVATLGRLRAHLEAPTPSFSLAGTVAVVCEDFETLYEDRELLESYERLRAGLPSNCSITLVTSTLSDSIKQRVLNEIPNIKVLEVPGLHRNSPGLRHTLVDCSSHRALLTSVGPSRRQAREAAFDARMEALGERLHAQPARQTLVVVNTMETCERVEVALKELSILGGGRRRPRVLAFHGRMAPEKRQAALHAFARPVKKDPTLRAPPPRILVATDRLSRGIDLPGTDHVILFDFPRDGAEYLRRVGLASRGDLDGKIPAVTSFVFDEQVAFAHALLNLDESGKSISIE